MRLMGVEFLTKNSINHSKLMKVFKNDPEVFTDSEEDQIVYDNLYQELKKGDFSLIGDQESFFLNSHNTSIWIPYLIYRWKFKEYPKRKIVAEFPVYLRVEPTSSCNLRCIMCFQVDKSFSSNKQFLGRMDFSLFKEIITQAHEGGTKAITLASRGEPTIHPQLADMLKFCSGKFFEIKLNTNATLLNEKLIHKIFEADISDIVFSVDSFTKSEYESIRIKGNFDKVLKNIIKVHEIREQFYPNSKMATRISGVQLSTQQNTEGFKKFWGKICDHVVIKSCFERWDTYNNPTIPGELPPCSELWTGLYVWYDGKCNPCDTDYKSNLNIGSLANNNLKDIWHGEAFKDLRKKHLNKKRNKIIPCDRCSHDIEHNMLPHNFLIKTKIKQ